LLKTFSIIVPAYNCGAQLARCLRSIAAGDKLPLEIIVADDGSTDNTWEIAQLFKAKVISTGGRRGPAFARNLAAWTAVGDILVFIDSDVCVKPDTLSKIGRRFELDPQLDALIGSYDDDPFFKDFISQYRNLMHAYVHQTGAERASTFWTGCGAIRSEMFLDHSGFNEKYSRPTIEDIELGYRLIRAGSRIVLDRSIQVTHLKRWTFWGVIRTDIMDRAIPWTELILRDRFMPNDLNLQLSQRVSVAVAFILASLSGAVAVTKGANLLAPLFGILFLMLAGWWGEFGSSQRPRRALLLLIFLGGGISAAAYASGMYGLIAPLAIAPGLLVLRRRYSDRRSLPQSYRCCEVVFVLSSIGVAVAYLVAAVYGLKGHLIFAMFVMFLSLGVMNCRFYMFLAGKRGVAFMLAAMPLNLLYHFYSGVSFLVGIAHFHWSRIGHRTAIETPPLPESLGISQSNAGSGPYL